VFFIQVGKKEALPDQDRAIALLNAFDIKMEDHHL
jgi:hypothetical protein